MIKYTLRGLLATLWISIIKIKRYIFLIGHTRCPISFDRIKVVVKLIRILGGITMQKKALVVIDIQNDITKNYKDIIDNINEAIEWATKKDMHVVYIRHENLSAGTRTFKTNTKGAELAPDLKVVSENIFTKYKTNALTSEAFVDFINENEISDFYLTGADASVCVKSTCYNLCKKGYDVNVLSDCICSYDKRKMDEMISYYKKKGSEVITLKDFMCS